MKQKRNPLAGVRVPLPAKPGGPQGGKKGKRGYDRRRSAEEEERRAHEWREDDEHD